MPSSVHLSINRDDELLGPSSQATLRSLGVKTGDLIYYYLDPSHSNALDQKLVSASSITLSVAESSCGKLTENATLVQEMETNQAICSDSTRIGSVPKSKNQASTNTNSGAEEPESKDVNLDGRKRLSEPLFLKRIFDESGFTCKWTIVIMSVHAVMIESGFVRVDPDSGIIFKEQILSMSLKYTLPALISANEPSGIESVSLKFQRLGHMVVVNGFLGVDSSVRRVCFDEREYVHIVDLLMGTLKSDKEDTLSMRWRMIKDGFVTPLLIDLCYNAGLELPPCFMCLPPKLKRVILEPLPGVDIARMACVSRELRDLVSDKDLWKQKCMEEFQDYVRQEYNVANWKWLFAFFKMNHSWMTKLGLSE